MKVLVWLLMGSFSLTAWSVDIDLTKSSNSIYQKVIDVAYEQIIADTYFEDDGYPRAIDKENFKFEIIPHTPDQVEVKAIGSGYSAWDDKDIDYDCNLMMEIIKSEPEVLKIRCSLENENWPFD